MSYKQNDVIENDELNDVNIGDDEGNKVTIVKAMRKIALTDDEKRCTAHLWKTVHVTVKKLQNEFLTVSLHLATNIFYLVACDKSGVEKKFANTSHEVIGSGSVMTIPSDRN